MIPSVTIGTVQDWHNWLKANHLKETKVNLISYKKHTGKPSISHREAMFEAIAFGWIDTTIKRIDEERYQRSFVKRTNKSRWSNATLSYAKQLIKEGKMSDYGLEMYKAGLNKPTIDHKLPKNPIIPEDLKKALGKDLPKLEEMAPSYRRYYIYWIEKAKREETRSKRIRIVSERIKLGKKPNDT
tara:strand:+ start:3122 stop:3676 length:555 start_codon:yes stop_codon:yes gene_type:complete